MFVTCHQSAKKQNGVATLVISVSVALLMAVAAVGMMRSGLLEQKIAANDIRAREAQEIAQAGLNFAMMSKKIPTQECNILDLKNDSLQLFDGVVLVPNNVNDQTSKEIYSPSIRWCYFRDYYFARSQAELNVEKSKAKYFVEAWFKRGYFIKSGIPELPPFLINGNFCSTKCNGNPSIVNSVGISGVVATGSINLDVFKNKSNYSADNEMPNFNGLSSSNSADAWSYVFDISLSDAKTIAQQNPGEPFYYFDGGKNINSSSDLVSSNEKPIVLIADSIDVSKCPKINGSIKIYGIVYLKNACKDNGWGGAEIYGSVVSDGDIDINANSKHYKFGSEEWGALKNNSNGIFVVPGTWRDFE